MLQYPVSVELPMQSFPPNAGAGLSHVRYRRYIPIPHVSEHDPQVAQQVQSPSTGQGPGLHASVVYPEAP